MENTFPTQAELDAIGKDRKAAADRYEEAKRKFNDDYKRRKDEVARKRAEISTTLASLRTNHAAAMQAVGVALAEGNDNEEVTEQADNIAAEIFKLEQREKALATLIVKPSEELFGAVRAAYEEAEQARRDAAKAYSEYEKRAEDAEKQFAALKEAAGKEVYLSHYRSKEDDFVELYESVYGALDCPSYMKERTIAAM